MADDCTDSRVWSSLFCILREIVQSSANSLTSEWCRLSPMSLMYTRNSSGPSIEPCGTPEVTFLQRDEQPLMTTR